MGHRDGAQDPGWRKPANASALAVDDGVDDGEVVNVEDDAEEVAADEDDDDAEENRCQVEIGVEVTWIQFQEQNLYCDTLKKLHRFANMNKYFQYNGLVFWNCRNENW